MKNRSILHYFIFVSAAIVIGCKVDVNSKKPKKVIWEASNANSNEKSKFHKVELYNKSGQIIYDSTVFISGLGYKVQHYNENKVISSISYYEPNTWIKERYEYDSNERLSKSVVLENSDTIEWKYMNQYDDSNQILVGISAFMSGSPSANRYVELLYANGELSEEKHFQLTEKDSTLFKTIHYYYDSSRLQSSVVTDIYQDMKDSLFINYDEKSRITYRSLRGEKYEIINMKTYSEDSLTIRSKDLRINQDVILRKKVLESW